MVFVIMRPAEQCRYEVFQMRSEKVCGKRMDRKFDIAQRRLYDFAVRRGKEDERVRRAEL